MKDYNHKLEFDIN